MGKKKILFETIHLGGGRKKHTLLAQNTKVFLSYTRRGKRNPPKSVRPSGKKKCREQSSSKKWSLSHKKVAATTKRRAQSGARRTVASGQSNEKETRSLHEEVCHTKPFLERREERYSKVLKKRRRKGERRQENVLMGRGKL